MSRKLATTHTVGNILIEFRNAGLLEPSFTALLAYASTLSEKLKEIDVYDLVSVYDLISFVDEYPFFADYTKTSIRINEKEMSRLERYFRIGMYTDIVDCFRKIKISELESCSQDPCLP